MSALNDPAPTLATLRSALATLTSTLDPLLASPLSALAQQLESGSSQTQAKHAERVQTKSGEASRAELDGRLDAARLNVSVAYVLLDLVWMYLKVEGIDPATHPVVPELERVKGYFAKIAAAQKLNEEKAEPRSRVDATAAGRFIKAALDKGAAPQGQHTRFEKKGEASSSSDSSSSDGSSDEEAPAPAPAAVTSSKEKGKGKAKQSLDPYAGYEEGKKRKAAAAPPAPAAAAAPTPEKTSKRKKTDSAAAASPVKDSPASAKSGKSSKSGKEKKKDKKSKR
ncbi:hypothetical protein FA09DRAFT_362783 [Tilletiopsis washingtonensis]|uniref:Exosome complex protein n=1 Tax=Tilletiopsis washingtonensis TaxID=58919 RepID=A0A316Z5B5_9BASI|nr:hypothetical protein FA09DRAFT_362783 [Tilletiopsis washingtonensis]PWN95405.1 hypothetical protein FA09DRAFT_362783 [Tilletiopsis washingtonensis]